MAPEPFRGFTVRLAALALLCLCTVTPAHALRYLNWNILNYPGTTGPARDPFYRTVIAPLSPDVIMTQEMTSQAGVTEFLNSMNVMEPGQWAAATFMDGGDTDAGLFYKPAKLQLLGQWAFYPNPANLLRYVHVWRLKPVGYSSAAAEFRVYGVHLKASSGSANEAQRLAEAIGLRDSLNAVPPGTHVIVTGDYNFYSGNEPGFLKLLESQADNDGRLYDPLGLQGIAWQDNTTMQYAWTQSPCKTGDTGCAPGAATGGMDDRFDLILPTLAWQDGAGLELIPGSYVSVGNDGLHHNNSIQDAPVIPEGAAYATALHTVSDHLPVRVDFRLPALVSASTAPIAFSTVIVGAGVNSPLLVTNAAPAPAETLHYSYAAPLGMSAPPGTLHAAAGVTNGDMLALDTGYAQSLAGTLHLLSNSVDSPDLAIPVSGTVLAHAAASLDSVVALGAAIADFGTHDAGDFAPQSVRVHNFGYDPLQARLSVTGGTITGGAGRFAITGGFAAALLAGTGRTYEVTFDPAGATEDSLYEATLAFTSADEALPGAAPQPDLAVTLRATVHATGTTGVGSQPPVATVLYAPFPNPVTGSGTVRFDVARAGDVALEVFDLSGRRASTLVRSALEPGRYSVQWNGVGEDGAPVRAGLYFVRLTAPGAGRQSARIAVIR